MHGRPRRAAVTILRACPSPRARRLTQLYLGLLLYGVSDGMLLLAGLGVDPCRTCCTRAFPATSGLGVGTWAVIVGLLVLLLWIPLGQKPGWGTLSNVVMVGFVIDLMLVVFAPVHGLPVQIVVMLLAVVFNGIATGAYIGAGLGPGPRDGLMTGLGARGYSIRVVRTGIELTVLATGWLLGGTVGVGTVVYALESGQLPNVAIPWLMIATPRPGPAAS